MRNAYFSLFVLVILGSSCQTSKDGSNEELATSTEQTETKTEGISALVPALPAVGEFAAKLQATGADYNYDNINAPAKAEQYISDSELKAAVNLGVYLSDLAYTSAYNETEASIEVLNAVVALSNSLGIEQAVMSTVAERYNNNINAPDSVKMYLHEMVSTSHESLRNSEKGRLAATVYAGFYVERLNIGLEIISSYPEDFPGELRQQLLVPVYHAILSQNKKVGEIKEYLKANIEGVENTPYYSDLIKMTQIYSEIDYDKILNSQDLSIIESDEKTRELATTIRGMRARIVQ